MTGSGEIVGGTRKVGYRFCVDVHRLVEVLGAIENPTEMDDKRAKSAKGSDEPVRVDRRVLGPPT